MYGKHHTEETKTKISKTAKENPKMVGGHDIISHHILYDHNDPDKNIIRVTRSMHMRIHWMLIRLGIEVSHINVTKDNKNVFKGRKFL